jgi:CRISPR/Cas system CMR subunit Cmr4 (Cas7 group RAMP superfamily)
MEIKEFEKNEENLEIKINLESEMEKKLCEYSEDYDSDRKLKRIGKLKLILVSEGTFEDLKNKKTEINTKIPFVSRKIPLSIEPTSFYYKFLNKNKFM